MKILVVGAHLDDIELACGGTIAKAIQNGHQVKTLIMSKSGYTNKDGKVQRSDEIAVKEGVEALNTLGVTDIEILDFPTKDIPFRSDVVNAIDLVIADYDPDGWLRYAQIYPTEEPGYPEFCYRRNETGYDFWWFYDENHGFDQRRAYDGGWYNPNTGESIPGPEGVSGTPELPFRLIGLEEVPFVLKSW